MVIKKAISYGLIFMLGFYLGSGGCIDRLLGSSQKQGCIEDKVAQMPAKHNLEHSIGVNDYGRRDIQKY